MGWCECARGLEYLHAHLKGSVSLRVPSGGPCVRLDRTSGQMA